MSLMTSPASVSNDALARVPPEQRPRIYSVPPSVSSSGQEVLELGEMAGIYLDPWQQLAVLAMLGERPDGKWAAEEAAITCPRQNGKDEILIVRMLGGALLLDEPLIVSSAHAFDTNMETMMRLDQAIEHSADLSRRVKTVNRANGKEGIVFNTGNRVRFRARTKGGARGFSGDLVILNEAMELPEKAFGAMRPIISARPNPQIIFAGTAVDQWQHDNGVVFARVRRRGIEGAPNLAYLEWSAHLGEPANDDPAAVDPDLAASEESWQQANPAFGHRIIARTTRNELGSMDPRTFAVERLGIGDWPSVDEEDEQTITATMWKACVDESSAPLDPVALAVDVTPDRAFASIGVAGKRADGLPHVELIERRRGTSWVKDRLVALVAKHTVSTTVIDSGSAAGSLIEGLEAAGLDITPCSMREFVQACGAFYDAADDAALRHLDQPELNAAARAGRPRNLSDSWAWNRKAGDVTPLVAVTLALWGLDTAPESVYEGSGRGILSFGG